MDGKTIQVTTLQRLVLRIVGVFGAVVFAAMLYLTYSVPTWVEDFAADYIEREAGKRIDTVIDSVQIPESDSALGRLAQSLYQQNEARIEALRENLRNKVHEQWAAALAEVRDLDCECRQKWEEWLEDSFTSNIAILQAANDQIQRFIHANYMDVTTELKRDIRIFAGSNAAAFFLLLLVSLLKPQAITHLFAPGMLLALSTLICSYFYVFEQNWLLTIIHSSYLGFAYLAWLAVVFLFLLDIAFNRARITTEIINTILNAIGSALSVGPC